MLTLTSAELDAGRLPPGTIFICSTSRLAVTLRERLARTRLRAAGGVCQTPLTSTLSGFLQRHYEQSLLLGHLPKRLQGVVLESFQERLLWEQVIGDSLEEGAAPLFDLGAMAATAIDADELAVIWGVPVDAQSGSAESRCFAEWQAEFLVRCAAAGWLDMRRFQVGVVNWLADSRPHMPEAVVFAGFDRYTPLEQRLISAIEACGSAVHAWDQATDPLGSGRVVRLADTAAECAAMADWAKRHLESDPARRLGIVVPDLNAVRDRLEYALDDALHPQAIAAGQAERPRCFNFSLGRPLAGLPMIKCALNLLALLNQPRAVDQADLSALLLSPFWSDWVAEAGGRARLDAAMRDQSLSQTSLPELRRLAERQAAGGHVDCPRLRADLARLEELAQVAGRARHAPALWPALLEEWLTAAGWPGSRALSSHEFQLRAAFRDVLRRLQGISVVHARLGLGEVLGRVGQLCREQIFQPETEGEPHLHVVGALESAGQCFDALWVMGLGDTQWPATPRPNPLLSASEQRRLATPHASAEVELAFATRIHARLQRAAAEVVFSYPASEADQVLRPSPLLPGQPLDDQTAWVVKPAWLPTEHELSGFEFLDDARAPPVADGEAVSGGTRLFADQARCPAWAYYRYRLGAQALGTASEGLDAAWRGSLIHAALEAFWQRAKDLATLQAWLTQDLAGEIAQAVEYALLSTEQARVALAPRLRRLESERVRALLEAWLRHEGERPGRFDVAAQEARIELEIDGIAVSTRIDRLDRLADGRLLVIDYKTGREIGVDSWFETRISDPQLPIYAAFALADQPLAGAVIARVHNSGPMFAGVFDGEGGLPRQSGSKLIMSFDWPSLRVQWEQNIRAIAREIRAGDAAVRFSDRASLRYCDVLPLLRLAEYDRQAATDGETG